MRILEQTIGGSSCFLYLGDDPPRVDVRAVLSVDQHRARRARIVALKSE
jgi:hypothetical protein